MTVRCLWQRNFHTAVRDEKKHLLAETVYQDSGREVATRLLVDSRTFRILEATLERPGRDGEASILVPGLHGKEAYLGAGRELREALAGVNDPLAVDLFAETVRGVVQAETFLYRERGFGSAVEYGRHWDKMYLQACRYYSNLERVTRRWEEYLVQERKGGYLFLRYKTYLLYQEAAAKYLVLGSFNDSFHEMNVSLRSDEQIVACNGDMLRVPDAVCLESTESLSCLLGADPLAFPSKKGVAGMLGGSQGCIHLVDLVSESWQTLQQFLSATDNLSAGGQNVD